jgi:hypothetical protein
MHACGVFPWLCLEGSTLTGWCAGRAAFWAPLRASARPVRDAVCFAWGRVLLTLRAFCAFFLWCVAYKTLPAIWRRGALGAPEPRVVLRWSGSSGVAVACLLLALHHRSQFASSAFPARSWAVWLCSFSWAKGG